VNELGVDDFGLDELGPASPDLPNLADSLTDLTPCVPIEFAAGAKISKICRRQLIL
jgi:hypothetical protein